MLPVETSPSCRDLSSRSYSTGFNSPKMRAALLIGPSHPCSSREAGWKGRQGVQHLVEFPSGLRLFSTWLLGLLFSRVSLMLPEDFCSRPMPVLAGIRAILELQCLPSMNSAFCRILHPISRPVGLGFMHHFSAVNSLRWPNIGPSDLMAHPHVHISR